jgi:hypothetical protein
MTLAVLVASTITPLDDCKFVHMPHSDLHQQSTMRTSATSSRPLSGMADFFAPDVFRAVLSDPATAIRLKSYCDSNACGENIAFLEKVCPRGPTKAVQDTNHKPRLSSIASFWLKHKSCYPISMLLTPLPMRPILST